MTSNQRAIGIMEIQDKSASQRGIENHTKYASQLTNENHDRLANQGPGNFSGHLLEVKK